MPTEEPITTDDRAALGADQPLIAGRYRNLQRLDRSDRALAVLARDESNGRLVTIDFLDTGAITPDALESAHAAIRRVATASGPGLVPTVDVVEYQNLLGIVSESVEGTSLAAMLRNGPLSIGQAASIGRGVSGVLARLHAVGAHHGALSPDEIIIDSDGSAHVVGSAAGYLGASVTQGAATVYAAPEQLTEHIAGAPADLYALGVMLYEMVVGAPPIANWDDTVVAERKVHDLPQPPSAVATLVPKEYDQLVLQLLDLRPIARPSAIEAEEALRRLEVPALDRPVRSATAFVVEQTPEPRRVLWPALALAAIVGVIAALLIVWLVQDDTKRVVVPTVVGQTQAQATATLRNAGFDVTAASAANNGVAPGVVAEQSPLGGERADDHATVAITVSSGPLTPAAPAAPPIIVTPNAPTVASSTSTTTTSTTTTTTPPVT